MGGSLMDADPWCNHYPSGEAVIEPLRPDTTGAVTWSEAAEKRLARVPGFLRKMVRKRAEAHVAELGEAVVTPEHMATLAARRFGDGFPTSRPQAANQEQPAASTLAWTAEATAYLQGIPGFLRDGVRQVAEDVATGEGRLEVNIKLLQRLEAEDDHQRRLEWDAEASQLLTQRMAERPPQARLFVEPSMEAAAEREAKRRGSRVVSAADIERVLDTGMAGVTWEAEALARVESAPEFVRAGIKKAAEFGARREGLTHIGSADLTRFRNRAMMRAVRRMKGFGMNALSFDGFDIARQRVPRLQENRQAEVRFDEIRRYLASRQQADGSGLGVIDQDLLEKMKAELKR
jgi:hypothetical protein